MINKVIIVGRVGKDPQIKQFGEKTVAKLSIATTEKYKGEEKTEWHNVSFWGAVAGVIEKYVNKGDLLYVEGKITTRQWEKDGTVQYITEILGQTMQMLGGGKGGGRKRREEPVIDPDEEIPF